MVHPCPVDLPTLAEPRHGHDGHSSGSESTQAGHAQCVCLGSCHLSSLTAPVQAAAVADETPLFDLAAFRPLTEALAPRVKPLRLLPPSTAPPFLS